MALELSVWSSFYRELSPEDALIRFRENGVYAVELSDEHGLALLQRSDDAKATGRAFGEFVRSIGIQMTQGHLWLKCRLVSNPEAIAILQRWIDLYEAIGIQNMVLHADVYNMEDWSIDAMHDANVEKFREIAAYIEGKDFHICIENLFRRGMDHIDQLLSLIRRVGSDRLAITLDTGHLNMVRTTSQRDFILTAGEKLRAIHIADNEGAADQHLMPFGRGTVDFVEVVRALKEIGYQGVFNYEIPGENRCPLPMRDKKLKYLIEGYHYLMAQ